MILIRKKSSNLFLLDQPDEINSVNYWMKLRIPSNLIVVIIDLIISLNDLSSKGGTVTHTAFVSKCDIRLSKQNEF